MYLAHRLGFEIAVTRSSTLRLCPLSNSEQLCNQPSPGQTRSEGSVQRTATMAPGAGLLRSYQNWAKPKLAEHVGACKCLTGRGLWPYTELTSRQLRYLGRRAGARSLF